MSDLVDRLRRPWTDFYTVKDGVMAGLLTEAADEIERLTPVYVAALAYVRMSEKYVPDETAVMDDDERNAVDDAIQDLYDNLKQVLNFRVAE